MKVNGHGDTPSLVTGKERGRERENACEQPRQGRQGNREDNYRDGGRERETKGGTERMIKTVSQGSRAANQYNLQ